MTTPLSVVGASGLALAQLIAPAPAAPGLWRLQEDYVLGTTANFLLTALEEADAQAAVAAARAEIERLNAVFNTRLPQSEISRLNRAAVHGASADMLAVLSHAEGLRTASKGAYNPGLGRATALWDQAKSRTPDDAVLRGIAASAQIPLILGDDGKVTRPRGVRLALDGLAKGYIVDRALAAGQAASPCLQGMLVDIGGDMACWGKGPLAGGGWPVGLPDPVLPYANAPLVSELRLKNQAVAASGRGARDRIIAGQRFSPTLDPATGQAVRGNIGATVVAPTAAQADGIATALMVMPVDQGLAFAGSLPGVEAWITDHGGGSHATAGWCGLATPAGPIVRVADVQGPDKWMADWVVQMTYAAPGKVVNEREFKSPYMALWITDKDGHLVRTIMLVGTDPKYQKENFIWWGKYKDKAPKMVELRANATSLSGRYPLFWPGYDDDWKFVPQGDYILHVETNQEHGAHTYRTLPLKLGRQGFKSMMPSVKESGSLEIVYGKRE